MKINRIHLIAYGPFSDATLDFAGGHGNFHLVYGPNEAGKSSALRALRNMFFGIPVRTTDSFRHPHPKLRIGAELARSDGETIAFIRRKGLRKTLRGADDRSALKDDALSSYLNGIDRDLFEQMFAIDHQDLVRGGEEIIAGGGRVGQALFAAGAGLVRLKRVQQHLDETLDALFKPSGSKPAINQTASLLKDVRRSQREALLLGKTWEAHHGRLKDAQARQEINRQRLTELKESFTSLERIHEALPLIARRKELMETLPRLESIPNLAEDFDDRRRATEKALAIAGHDFERTRKTIADLEERLEALSVPEALLRQAPSVEALQQELGSFRKAKQDRPVLKARMQTLRKQASTRLSQMGFDQGAQGPNSLRLTPAAIGEIQDMGQRHEHLKTRGDSVRQRCRELEAEIAALEEEKQTLPATQDVSDLKSILQDAQDAGALEKHLLDGRQTLALQEENLVNRLKRQALWTGVLEALDTLTLPSRETIDRFETQWTAATNRIERMQEELAQKREESAAYLSELRLMESDRDIPTEADLTNARGLRDMGWGLVRRRLEGHGLDREDHDAFMDQFGQNRSLPDAFEESMHRADHVADRLRREAEQVSRKHLLEARRQQTEDILRDIAPTLDAARKDKTELQQEWEALWSPSSIRPLSPKEMRAWLADMTAIREKADELQAVKTKNATLASQIDRWKARLADALNLSNGPTRPSLSELVDIARRRIASQEDLQLRSERIEQTLQQLNRGRRKLVAEGQDLKNDLQSWEYDWRSRIVAIGLAADAGPAAALAMVESLREARAQQEEADILEKRIQGIDRDAEAFGNRVSHLVDNLAPELREHSPEEAGILLNAKLTEGRSQQSRQNDLQRQLEAARAEWERAEQHLADTEAQMQALCREARCKDPGALPEIVQRSRERRTMMQERQDIDNRLRRLSAGATVEDFVAEAEAVAPDSLIPEMDRLREAISAVEEERSDLDQTIGTARAELKRMDGRSDAAAFAEEAEHLLARLESQVAQYARVKIAAVLLARTIEQYREKHQGPLIERASLLFNRITGNAFRGIRAEYDEKGNPVLVGIRSTGEEPIGVDGMSDGTADQLYLALRLASLDHYLDNGEPLPFIVDDILLRFDDERALATLKILMELSAKTQVIFFTHHHHLVTLAQRAFDDAMLNITPLSEASPTPSSN